MPLFSPRQIVVFPCGGSFNSGLPRSGKKSLENDFFQVREKSGNLGLSQGIYKKCRKSGKRQRISKFSQKLWSLAIYYVSLTVAIYYVSLTVFNESEKWN